MTTIGDLNQIECPHCGQLIFNLWEGLLEECPHCRRPFHLTLSETLDVLISEPVTN